MQRLIESSTSTSAALRTINSTGGKVQTLALQHGRIGVDIQGKHTRVDGEVITDHGFVILTMFEAIRLRDAIGAAIDAAAMPVERAA